MIAGKHVNQVVQLREVEVSDLPIFFEFQLDPEANQMAAFTSKDPSDREAFEAHWQNILADQSIPIQTIIFGGQVAGSVLSYVMEGEREVSYWIGKEFWGRGIATRALALYLDFIAERPLYARAAKDNLGSIRVLEKNGFKVITTENGFANARGIEIEESVLILKK
jgi:RimJ/RimL family protein N-acetyltransferase